MPKKGGLDSLQIRGGGFARKRGVVFLRGGGLIPQCTLWLEINKLGWVVTQNWIIEEVNSLGSKKMRILR